MHRAEGLGALGRDLIKGRNAREILENVVHLDFFGDAVAADAGKQLLHARLDDEHHMVKARADRVIDGVLHQDLAVGTEAIHLLVAAVAGAHAGSHDQKRRAHKTSSFDMRKCVSIYYTGFACRLQEIIALFTKT